MKKIVLFGLLFFVLATPFVFAEFSGGGVFINGGMQLSPNSSPSGTLYLPLVDSQGVVKGKSANAWQTYTGGGSGTPGGSDGDLQYNNAGAFGGFGDFNDTTNILSLPDDLSVPGSLTLASVLRIGSNAGGKAAYNVIDDDSTVSSNAGTGIMNAANDVYIEGDVEVDGAITGAGAIQGASLFLSSPLSPSVAVRYAVINSSSGKIGMSATPFGASGGGSSAVTDGGATTYVTSTTDNFAIGGTGASAPFYFDKTTNTAHFDNLSISEALTINANQIIAPNLSILNTIQVGSNEIADSTGINGAVLKADTVKDTAIDWGTGANQVSQTDLPADGSTDWANTIGDETFQSDLTVSGDTLVLICLDFRLDPDMSINSDYLYYAPLPYKDVKIEELRLISEESLSDDLTVSLYADTTEKTTTKAQRPSCGTTEIGSWKTGLSIIITDAENFGVKLQAADNQTDLTVSGIRMQAKARIRNVDA